MIRIGLTGGCSTGKSTVAEMFRQLGPRLTSADEIVHRLLREEEEVKSAVAFSFGQQIRAKDGSIDRAKLGEIVFDSPENLSRLTDLIYPRVRAEIRRFFEEGEKSGEEARVAEVPLLIEGGALELYDVIVVVTASYENQLKRFLKKGGTKQDLDRRIRYQMDMAEKVKCADYVIDNDGSVEETFEQVKRVYDDIRRKGGAAAGR